jgi:hypothetical protein
LAGLLLEMPLLLLQLLVTAELLDAAAAAAAQQEGESSLKLAHPACLVLLLVLLLSCSRSPCPQGICLLWRPQQHPGPLQCQLAAPAAWLGQVPEGPGGTCSSTVQNRCYWRYFDTVARTAKISSAKCI